MLQIAHKCLLSIDDSPCSMLNHFFRQPLITAGPYSLSCSIRRWSQGNELDKLEMWLKTHVPKHVSKPHDASAMVKDLSKDVIFSLEDEAASNESANDNECL